MTETPEDIPQANELLTMIKLRTGEEILCTLVDERDTGIVIESPIQIRIIPFSEGNGTLSSQVLATKWCPYAESDTFFISDIDIMVCEPMAKAAYQIYVNSVNRYNQQVGELHALKILEKQSKFFVDCNNTIN
jgi:hypothetical protein